MNVFTLSSEDRKIRTTAPARTTPLTLTISDFEGASGDQFAFQQNAAMSADNPRLNPAARNIHVVSTHGGFIGKNGQRLAASAHTGSAELHLLIEGACEALIDSGYFPIASYCSDNCDGRTQGTLGGFDSLPSRNDAYRAMIGQCRSLPQRRGVLGVATCDKGLPAVMMMLAAAGHQLKLPGIVVLGGVALPPAIDDSNRAVWEAAGVSPEDAGKSQSLGSRLALGQVTLEQASLIGCAACATVGGGCQFFGTAATAQVIAEALGMALPHTALAPSGQPIWEDSGRRAALALDQMIESGTTMKDILTADAVHNAMVIHAMSGGSTNLLLHIPAICRKAGLEIPTVEQWNNINREVPRILSVLPNGPVNHVTVRAFLAGGVPEMMLHARSLGLLKLDAKTVTGKCLGDVLEDWESSDRREYVRETLREQDGVDPDEVIMAPAKAKKMGLEATVIIHRGNLAPEGALVKSSVMDPVLFDANGVFKSVRDARVFTGIESCMNTIRAGKIKADDAIVLIGLGPMVGMPEIANVTNALKDIPGLEHVVVITDARFSGHNKGASFGHVTPEALKGGPIGKVVDGDKIQVYVNRPQLEASIDLVIHHDGHWSVERGSQVLQGRETRNDLMIDPRCPEEVIQFGLSTESAWKGCVADTAGLARLMGLGPILPEHLRSRHVDQ
jgi:putative YjhG/YagF family dehydratase